MKSVKTQEELQSGHLSACFYINDRGIWKKDKAAGLSAVTFMYLPPQCVEAGSAEMEVRPGLTCVRRCVCDRLAFLQNLETEQVRWGGTATTD